MFTIEQISSALALHKRRQYSDDEFPGFAKAAVLIPIFPTAEGLSVLFTVRTNEVETHKGQISFPGGMNDPSDVDAVQTALRETEEEIGITKNEVQVIGTLDDHPVPSRFIITPVVGFLKKRPHYTPNPKEVAEVFDVPLRFFADENNGRTEKREFSGKTVIVWYFQTGNHLIWGATAAMVRNLIDVVSGQLR